MVGISIGKADRRFLHRQLVVGVWSPQDACHNERSFVDEKNTTYIFVREVQGIKRYYDPENQVVKQYVTIQESSFSQSLVVRFHTDAFGYEMDEELEELRKYGTGGWISYLDEESYKERLRLLADLTVEYGLDLLDKMSHEEEAIPTKAMAEKLFDEHKRLADAFAEEYHIKTIPEQPEDIDEWLGTIKKTLMDSADLPYEEVKELLVKVAAFMGKNHVKCVHPKAEHRGVFSPQMPRAFPY